MAVDLDAHAVNSTAQLLSGAIYSDSHCVYCVLQIEEARNKFMHTSRMTLVQNYVSHAGNDIYAHLNYSCIMQAFLSISICTICIHNLYNLYIHAQPVKSLHDVFSFPTCVRQSVKTSIK